MDNDFKLRSQLQAALDGVLPPVPWLEATVAEGLRRRLHGGTTDRALDKPRPRLLSFAPPTLQLAVVAVALVVTLAVGLVGLGMLRHNVPAPASVPTSLHIYWANSGEGSGTTIGRANGNGTDVNQQFITGARAPWEVAVDLQHIYWVNNADGSIGRANLDGTGVDQTFITGAQSPLGIAVDARHIYWSNAGFDCHGPVVNGCDGTTIGRANLDGTGVNQSFITGADTPGHIAVDRNYIYWSNFNGNTIGRATLDGTGVNQSFIATAVSPSGVAVDATYIYWRTPSGIGRAHLDGTAPNQQFIKAAFGSGGVEVDGAHIFWANRDRGNNVTEWFLGTTIGRANLDGTAVIQNFISGANGPTGVAVGQL